MIGSGKKDGHKRAKGSNKAKKTFDKYGKNTTRGLRIKQSHQAARAAKIAKIFTQQNQQAKQGAKVRKKGKKLTKGGKKGKKSGKKTGGGCKEGEYLPEKCCVQGIPCLAPCYRENHKHFPCVDEGGDVKIKESVDLILKSCKKGRLDGNTCCEKHEIGPQCLTPCSDGDMCLPLSGNISEGIRKQTERHNRKKIINKFINITNKNKSGGGYNYIINPATRRRVNIYGKLGKSIIKNYLKILHGGSNTDPPSVHWRSCEEINQY